MHLKVNLFCIPVRPPIETMTLYAVKTPNGFDFKGKKMYFRIADVENCNFHKKFDPIVP
jgi:hypothetical protein